MIELIQKQKKLFFRLNGVKKTGTVMTTCPTFHNLSITAKQASFRVVQVKSTFSKRS